MEDKGGETIPGRGKEAPNCILCHKAFIKIGKYYVGIDCMKHHPEKVDT